MSTYTTTVPPQTGDLPRRDDVLDPLQGILLDAVETLHGYSGTDWMAERCTAYERDLMVLATKYLCGMMTGLGLWDRSTPQDGA